MRKSAHRKKLAGNVIESFGCSTKHHLHGSDRLMLKLSVLYNVFRVMYGKALVMGNM